LKYPLHRPVVRHAEVQAVSAVLRSGDLVHGRVATKFEAAVAKLLGFKRGVAVSSGTSALHVSLKALVGDREGEVIVPAFGYPATANVVALSGLKVRFADISPTTWALSPESVAAVAGPETLGAILVHPFGMPAPLTPLTAQADSEGWWLIQDAACVLGTDPAVFGPDLHRSPCCLSFHPRKVLTTGEGGMVLTDDDALAASMKRWVNHGVESTEESWLRFAQVGFNYRLTDIAAAIGMVQVARLDTIAGTRRAIANAYREALSGVDGVRWHAGYDRPDLSVQSLVVTLAPEIDRDALIKWLRDEGIGTTLGGYAIHLQPAYVARCGDQEGAFPEAERLYRTSLTLPVTEGMATEDVGVICDTLKRGIDIHG